MARLLTQAILVGLAAGQTVSANIPNISPNNTDCMRQSHQSCRDVARPREFRGRSVPILTRSTTLELSFVVELELTVNSILTTQIRPPAAR
jgi:hypothetical protein